MIRCPYPHCNALLYPTNHTLVNHLACNHGYKFVGKGGPKCIGCLICRKRFSSFKALMRHYRNGKNHIEQLILQAKREAIEESLRK